MSPNNDIKILRVRLAACGSLQETLLHVRLRSGLSERVSCHLRTASCELLLRYPVQHLVERSRERQEPGAAVVQPQRRARKRNLGERIIRLSICDPFRHLLPLPGRHRHAVSRVSDRKVDTIHLPRMWHDVETEIERPAPDIIN